MKGRNFRQSTLNRSPEIFNESRGERFSKSVSGTPHYDMEALWQALLSSEVNENESCSILRLLLPCRGRDHRNDVFFYRSFIVTFQ
jgi:hypothetical protein